MLTPPRAAMQPHMVTLHGETLVDPYFWMRERDNPAVIEHLNAENAYTAAMMAQTEALQETIYQEMLGRIQQVDTSAEEVIGAYAYYTRTEAGREYQVYCRRHTAPGSPEEILLDANAMAEGQTFFKLGVFEVSPNHRLLAYATDTSGSEVFTLYVKDLTTGEIVDGPIAGVFYGLAWANDNATYFYALPDATWRPYKIMRRRIGTPRTDDTLVYEESDMRFGVHVGRLRSDAYIVVVSQSNTTSETHLVSADRPDEPFRLLLPRRAQIEHAVQHRGEHFYLWLNDTGRNFRLVRFPVGNPEPSAWEEVVPHRDAVLLEWCDLFADHLVLYEREQGMERIRIMNLESGAAHTVAFDEPAYAIEQASNNTFKTQTLRFVYTSLVTPRSTIAYNMETRERTVLKQDTVPTYEPSRYRSERLFVAAADGAQIPVTLVYRDDLLRDGTRPMLLYSYGAYGANIQDAFVQERVSLLDRGFVWAIAHIRGGAEMGRPWYDNGKLLHKKNTFTDFIACADYLVAQGYTARSRLAIMGRSAGGLLMGAVTTMRPDLCAAVVAGVPFVDVINTMLDETIPLTVGEFEEWGNPNDPVAFAYMRSYSPYDNTHPAAYPHILCTAGLSDPRVQYWEPAKWVAKLRTVRTDDRWTLLKTNMSAGHAGASGRFERLRELAFEYAFVVDTIIGGG